MSKPTLGRFSARRDSPASATAQLSPEVHLVARGTVVNIVGMAVGALLGFCLTVVISRWLQPKNAGAFFELTALFTILSNTFELGADTGLTRWIAKARAVGGMAEVRRMVRIALVPPLLASVAAALAISFAAPQLAHIFLHQMPPGTAANDVRLMGWLVPFGALTAIVLAGPRGYARMWPYLVIEGLGKPFARMLFVVLALLLGLGLQGSVVAWSIPLLGGLLAAWVIFDRLMRRERSRETSRAPEQDVASSAASGSVGKAANPYLPSTRGLAAEFWRFAGPRGFAGTFQITVAWLDILLVGAILSRYAAGVYGAVSKLAVVGTFAMQGSQLAIGPQLSALLARKQYTLTENLYQSATGWLLMAGAPMYVVFTFFPHVVLGIFGHRYTAGASALVVLSLAMLVNLGTGNVGVVLLMGGKS